MSRLSVTCTLVAALAILFALCPQSLQATPLCPLLNATKHGTYVVHATGNVVGVGPAVGVGEITYDGHGNTLANFTLNVNGNVHTFTAVPGTYTINSDCSGTSLEAGAHYSFVTSPDGNVTTWMETDPGSVISGTEVRLNPVEEFEAQVRPGNNRVEPANLRRGRKEFANPRAKTAAVTRQLPRSS